ncbi:restriction endonuclease subunit S [Flagellimonas halotolerans]|uniref:Restriction endonuclease subunit S n=1 Tax=Flagellimonas halotolerans TaxID=3112164 RepID=A0ABU6ITC8_9FLAO|nr:restriction endonuclease subunit S [Muricauda sp. SYSU M86414]MEC3966468.1 restriction endonuclease subunit S [Muricauda sp. SYSU M86414]MEC4266395.1 restriction endonuclease subunit S [Muricauda sp. SYSU M84420]
MDNKISDLLNQGKRITYGVVQPGEYSNDGIFMIRSQNYSKGWCDLDEIFKISKSVDKPYERSRVREGDLLITVVGGNIGTMDVVPKCLDGANISRSVSRISIDPSRANPQFVKYFLEKNIKKLILINQVGGAQPVLNLKDLSNFRIPDFPLDEQQKIASILSDWDKAIKSYQNLLDKLKLRKRGLSQQLLTGNIRLTGFSKEWKEITLGEITDRITNKNEELNDTVVTISAQRGFVKQEDFFNKRVASSTLSGYFLIKKGDFAYNKSYSSGYPMGAFKRLDDFDKAVVTTLYICFSVKENIDSDFLLNYFEAGLMVKNLMRIAQEGGRAHGLLNIGLKDFFDLKLTIPTIEEQKAIANVLNEVDKEIEYQEAYLKHLQLQKKGLMQQLLTGKIRVN